MNKLKLNIGCGTDYRDGFVNIDGSDSLNKVDKLIRLNDESLADHFCPESVDFILANDIIEHHFHWEALSILSDFYKILKKGGHAEIRVPDCEWLINTTSLSIKRKIIMIFGGQDIPQGVDPKMDESRKKYPEFFCHKYGWVKEKLLEDLSVLGFINIQSERVDSNLVTKAFK